MGGRSSRWTIADGRVGSSVNEMQASELIGSTATIVGSAGTWLPPEWQHWPYECADDPDPPAPESPGAGMWL